MWHKREKWKKKKQNMQISFILLRSIHDFFSFLFICCCCGKEKIRFFLLRLCKSTNSSSFLEYHILIILLFILSFQISSHKLFGMWCENAILWTHKNSWRNSKKLFSYLFSCLLRYFSHFQTAFDLQECQVSYWKVIIKIIFYRPLNITDKSLRLIGEYRNEISIVVEKKWRSKWIEWIYYLCCVFIG